MKIWFNEFLQNAAFPAVVLAFACSPINNEIPDVRTGRSTDPRRAEKTLISYIDPMNREGWYQPTTKGPALKQDRAPNETHQRREALPTSQIAL
jgi:hypothetical protein